MKKLDHVKDILQETLEDLGIFLSEDSLNTLADNAVLAAESFDAHSTAPVAYNDTELRELKGKVEQLEERKPCRRCAGAGGYRVNVGNSHSSVQECFECGGTGYALEYSNRFTARLGRI